MAQDEKMVVPVEPTREMWAAGSNAVIGYKQRHHDKVVADVWSAMLSAAPAQPATVEGAEWLTDEDHAVIKRCVERQPKLYMRGQHEGYYVHSDIANLIDMIGRAQPATLDEGAAGERERIARHALNRIYLGHAQTPKETARLALDEMDAASPSPPAATEAASRNNVTSGDEVWVKAKASDVCTSCCGVCIPTIHERDVNTYVHWSSVSLSPTPADDALRVADADAKWLARWLGDQKEGGHCGEGNFERRERAIWNDRIDRILAALKAGGVK